MPGMLAGTLYWFGLIGWPAVHFHYTMYNYHHIQRLNVIEQLRVGRNIDWYSSIVTSVPMASIFVIIIPLTGLEVCKRVFWRNFCVGAPFGAILANTLMYHSYTWYPYFKTNDAANAYRIASVLLLASLCTLWWDVKYPTTK